VKLPDVAALDILKRIKPADYAKLSQSFDPKIFGMSMAVILSFYLLIFFYVFLNANNTIEALEAKMDSYTLSFEEIGSHDFLITHNNHSTSHNTTHMESAQALPDMVENSPMGPLPIIRKKDGLTSFRAFQPSFEMANIHKKPAIAFIIKDFGLSEKTSQSILDLLPEGISLVLSPYSTMLDDWITKAHEKNLELWAQLPVESIQLKNHDTGPLTVMKKTNFSKNLKVFHRIISNSIGSVGITSYSDIIMNQPESPLEKIIGESYERGLGYLELNPEAPDYFTKIAFQNNAPLIKADLEVFRPTGKNNSFETLEQIAINKGYAVAVLPAYPDIIKHLAIWIEKVGKIDYTLVPVSAIYDIPLHLNNEGHDIPVSGGLKKSDMVMPEESAHHGTVTHH